MDNKYQKAKIKNLEYRLYFQKYNIKEKKKKKEKKKPQELLNNNNNNHRIIYIYGICFKNRVSLFFLKSNSWL